jgi:topoisomerase-4 subunit A
MDSLKENIQEAPFDKALGERYLSYALSTIMARSLPDVRDGLKPVQRRILYAMYESGNTSDRSFRKSASAVGFVMMKYHPHGNDPIYEAMVRMAQDFSIRYPLVQGQGNFGSLDGDNAAAMRYTEARLSKIGGSLLEGIQENAVDFNSTYNGETVEPQVLPTFFPNLLANGATGIAVGMATNIPPHNADEVCEALIHLIEKPAATTADILKIITGPDFPTGGVIVDDWNVLHSVYETGRGSIRVRARYEVEKLKGGLYQIVVTEIPYQVQKGKLIEKIATLLLEKKLPLLGDVRDESTTDVRVVIVPRTRLVDPVVLMESLFRSTDLENRFAVNMNVLDQGKIPHVMSLKGILQAFLNHCREVVLRRAQFRLAKINERLEILVGYQIVYLNLDEVIRIIREHDEPKPELINRFKLSDLQAESILNMRLRALRKLEEEKLIQEVQELEKEKIDVQALIDSDKRQWKKVAKELQEIKKQVGTSNPIGKRRTTFEQAPTVSEVPIEAMVERESVTVICSDKGWIRALKGQISDPQDIKYKEGDKAKFIIPAETTDKLIVFASNGRFYTLGVDKLPGGRGQGEPIRLMIDLDQEETILSLIPYKAEAEGKDTKFIVVSKDGKGFMVSARNMLAQTKSGKQVLVVDEANKAHLCCPVKGDMVAMVGDNRKLLIVPVQEIPEMTKGRGVIFLRYREGTLSDLKTFSSEQGLTWKKERETVFFQDWRLWVGKRGQTGRLVPPGFPKNNKFD